MKPLQKKWFVVLFMLALAQPVSSQWQLKASGLVKIGGMYRTEFGMIAEKDGILWAGHSNLVRSTDLGNTWTVCSPLEDSATAICDIQFFDAFTGLVSTSNGFLFLTTDQGNTWTTIKSNKRAIYSACFAGSTKDIVISDGSNGTLSITHNGGATWREFPFHSFTMKLFPMNNGILYAMPGIFGKTSSVAYSTDKGETWIEKPGTVDFDCWSFVANDCDDQTIIAANEAIAGGPPDATSDIKKSSDRGVTWQDKYSRQKPYLCGSVVSTQGVFFAQTVVDGNIRSTDDGESWQQCGGPPNRNDSRFICALTKNHLFAVDSLGNIWETTNSGGDSLSVTVTGPKKNTAFRVSSSKIIKDSTNIIVHLPIFVHHVGAMSSIDIILHYPPGSLKYLGSLLTNGTKIDVPGSAWNGRAKLHIDSLMLNSFTDSLIGHCEFLWSPLEFDCAIVHFDSIASVVSNSCYTFLTNDSCLGVIGAYDWCGNTTAVSEPTIQKTAVPFILIPNPAVSNVLLESSSYTGTAELIIYDLLGKALYRSRGHVSPEQPLQLNTATLSPGSYRVLILREGFVPYNVQLIRQ